MFEKLIEVLQALVVAVNANTAALKEENGAEKPKRQRGRTAAGEDPVTGAALPANQNTQAATTAAAQAAQTTAVQTAAPAASATPATSALTYKDVADLLVKVAEAPAPLGRDAAIGVLGKLQQGCPNLPGLKPEFWAAAHAEYSRLLGTQAAPAAAASSLV